MSSRLAYFSESPNTQQQRRRQQRGKVGSEGTQRGRRFSMPNNLHDIQPLVVGRVGAREGRAKRGAVADLDGHEGLLSDLDHLDALAEEVSPGTAGCAPTGSSNGSIAPAIPPGQVLHGGQQQQQECHEQQQEPERGSGDSEDDEEEQRGGDTLGYLTSSSSSAAVQRGSRTARAVAGGGHSRMGGAGGAAVATVHGGGGGGLEGGGLTRREIRRKSVDEVPCDLDEVLKDGPLAKFRKVATKVIVSNKVVDALGGGRQAAKRELPVDERHVQQDRLAQHAEHPLGVIGGLLGCEMEALQGADTLHAERVFVACMWCQRAMVERHQKRGIRQPAPIVAQNYRSLSEGMNAFMQCKKIVDTPFPFPYAQCVMVALIMFMFSFPLQMCEVINDDAAAVVVSFCGTCVVVLVNRVAAELEEPFMDEANDLPLADLHVRALQVFRFPYATPVLGKKY
jgi:hypothetical protein